MRDCGCGRLTAIDYGSEDAGKQMLHGPDGPVPIPVAPRGLTPAEKFIYNLDVLLRDSCVVCESPTIGSSGAEPEEVAKIVASASHSIYVVSARRVKNYLKDHPDVVKTDAECARIIYEIAMRPNAELKVWRFVAREDKFRRQHRSVRPHDKRLYRGPVPDFYMSYLAPFETLPDDLQALLGNGLKRKPNYSRSTTMPLAMAFEEEGHETRNGYEFILGLYGDGYKSFYRRGTVALMQKIAKRRTGARLLAEITPAQRKEAWKEARRAIRRLYYLSRQHQQYAQQSGTTIPLAGHDSSQLAA